MTYDQTNEFCFHLAGSGSAEKATDSVGQVYDSENKNHLFELKPLGDEAYKTKWPSLLAKDVIDKIVFRQVGGSDTRSADYR